MDGSKPMLPNKPRGVPRGERPAWPQPHLPGLTDLAHCGATYLMTLARTPLATTVSLTVVLFGVAYVARKLLL